MTTKPLDQLYFIAIYLRHWLISPFTKTETGMLPQHIGDYHFLYSLEKTGTVRDFTLGVYQNSHGNQAIAKLWVGKRKTPAYYTLLNECLVYEVLTAVLRRIEPSLPSRFAHIRIPTFLASEETDHSLLILTERLEGIVAREIDTKRQAEIYMECVDFLQYIGSQFTPEERRRLAQRTPASFVGLYPFLIAKACLSHPRYVLPILQSIPTFLRCIPVLLSQQQQVLVHRDLHTQNILVADSAIGIIDFQLCVFSFPLAEFTTSLRYLWEEGDVHLHILRRVQQAYGTHDHFGILFRGLMVHAATHGLTGKNFTSQIIDRWAHYLNFARRATL